MRNFGKTYSAHYKSILMLGIPLLLGQLGVIITGFADTVMVGRYSTQALASASFVNSMFTLMTILCMGYSYGLTPIVSALFARGDEKRVGEMVKNSMVLNSVFGLLVGLFMLVIYFFIENLGQPDELLPTIKPYYIIVLLSMVPIVLINVLRQFTDGIGQTQVSMWILTLGNLLNIVGNYFLIYGVCGFPEWGLFGAGISTLFARIMMLMGYVAWIMIAKRYKSYVRGYREGFVKRSSMKAVNNNSWPVSMQMGMETGIFTFATILVGWLGSDYLAAYQVVLVLSTFGFMVYYSFGASMAIKVANFDGLGDIEQLKLSVKAGYHIILGCALLASLIFIFAGEWIIGWFTTDPVVVGISLSLIAPLVLYQFGDATQIAYANALRGIKCVMPLMKFAFFAYVIIGLPSSYLFAFPFKGGAIGIYLSFVVALFVAGVLYWTRYRREIGKMQYTKNT